MPRYKLVIEYDGGPFCGWQRQAEDLTVQGAIETAVLRFSGEQVRLTCAGRTDAGVHAIHQVAHLDLAKEWRTDTVRDAVNAHLRPLPVAILSAEVVPETFDARHSAIRRHYRYRILNRRSPAALTRAHVWHVPWPLDPELMQAAAQRLTGRHDFSAFRAAECQANSPVRTLEQLDVTRQRMGLQEEIVVATCARSFLHHQVRAMVGTLMLAGCRRLSADDVADILRTGNKTRCGPLAPASGLTFVGVDYDEK